MVSKSEPLANQRNPKRPTKTKLFQLYSNSTFAVVLGQKLLSAINVTNCFESKSDRKKLPARGQRVGGNGKDASRVNGK